MNNTIAGKPIVPCPMCGSNVREDLLEYHNTRCAAQRSKPTLRAVPAADDSRLFVGGVRRLVDPRNAPPKKALPKKAPPKKAPNEPGFASCGHCGMQVPSAHLAAHRARCTAPPPPRASATHVEREPRTTKEGYLIARCWSCGRRVCVTSSDPRNQTVYEIDGGRARSKHLCDGTNSCDRRSKLVYVDSQAGSLTHSIGKRRPRKP